MSNIRQVQWNEGAPKKLEPGMVIKSKDGNIRLVGNIAPQTPSSIHSMLDWDTREVAGWAWLIQPHELNWLEDMASRKTRTQA